MQAALLKIAPDFELWNRERFSESARAENRVGEYGLSLVQGDFNGDSRVDAAVLGHGKDNQYLIAIVSTPGRGYVAQMLEPPRSIASVNSGVYLRLEPRGVVDIPNDLATGMIKFQLAHDGIEYLDNSAGELYYWDRGGFKKVISGD